MRAARSGTRCGIRPAHSTPDSVSSVAAPLTTTRQPLLEMAVTAAELALSMARGEAPAQPRVELTTELVVRESTARPRARQGVVSPGSGGG